MKPHKQIIYFPSFSTGPAGNSYVKNVQFNDGSPYRFWSDDYVKDYIHKYFLITAGHDYKKLSYRADLGLHDSLVFGDSGGYQIATGAIEWNLNLRTSIFNWLENNSDIAMNLDIPTRGRYEGKFSECLEISRDNFKFFHANQSGKTDFLNVIQGVDIDQYAHWYKNVKEFQFSGWALGGARTPVRLLAALSILLENGELHDPRNKWMHFLGISKVIDGVILTYIQRELEKTDSTIQITFDSSSPSRSSVFGLFYTGYNFKSGNFEYIHLPRIRDLGRPLDNGNAGLPHFTKFDSHLWKNFTYDEFAEFKSDHYAAMVLHNFAVFKDCFNEIHSLFETDQYIYNQLFSKDANDLMEYIDFIFTAYKNGSSPIKAYKSILPRIKTLESRMSPKEAIKHNFF